MTTARRVLLALVLVALAVGLGDQDAVAPQATPELDVLVAVDRTTSMSALDDPSGSRITAVRRDLVALADQLGPARFSVVTFGESASVRLPFTSDRGTFDDEVTSIEVERADGGAGSSVGIAVPLMESILGRSRSSSEDRIPVVVFVSDGENTASTSQASFRRLGSLSGAAVVLGYGTPDGAAMPLRRVGLSEQPPPPSSPGAVVTTPTGEPAVSRADDDNLQSIAAQLGGRFVSGSESRDVADVAAELTEAAYADLEPGRPQRELRWIWALLALLLVLPDLRRGWRLWLAARRDLVR